MVLTELTLVSTRVVKLLDLVVRVLAVSGVAALSVGLLAEDVVVLVEVGPSVVALVVVVEAEVLVVGV